MRLDKGILRNAAIGLAVVFTGSLLFFQGGEEAGVIRERLSAGTVFVLGGETLLCTQVLQQLYEARDYMPLWDRESEVESLVREIGDARWEGLNPEDYHLQTLQRWLEDSKKTPAERAEMDLLCSDALLLYTSHLASGKIDPQKLDIQWHIVNPPADPLEALRKVGQVNVGKIIEAFKPGHKEYKALKRSLRTYVSASAMHWEPLADSDTLGSGTRNASIPRVRRMLHMLGDLETGAAGDSMLFDDRLQEALKIYQRRHGLVVNGRLDKETIGALNVPLGERINRIRVNMERWRWMPRTLADYYLEANTAGFDLRVVKNGKVERLHRIIVGRTYRTTPVFSDTMTYLVLNPYWTVPPGILTKDVLPAIRKDRGYLTANHMQVFDQKGVELNPRSVDWEDPVVNTYTYRQMPGPHNAMGQVKFMFPNEYSVYLHDTPDKRLFDKKERTFSSGCIRVENALDLAEYVLSNDSARWDRDRLMRTLATADNQSVSLRNGPVVYILYLTARADADPQHEGVHFYKDIYKRDTAISLALLEPKRGGCPRL